MGVYYGGVDFTRQGADSRANGLGRVRAGAMRVAEVLDGGWMDIWRRNAMGVGRKFARGRCDGWIAVEEEGSMEGEGASSVESWRDGGGGGGAECGYEQQRALTV